MKKNLLLNPQNMEQVMADPETQDLFNLTTEFFERKGNFSMRIDARSKRLPTDWYQFIKESGLFATLLTPAPYGDAHARWDHYRITAASELLGFYGMYQYTFQVSILGVGPIWISNNEKQKQELAQLLKEGHVFAFGMSERDHGADLYSNEARITPCALPISLPTAPSITSAILPVPPRSASWGKMRRPANLPSGWSIAGIVIASTAATSRWWACFRDNWGSSR